MENHHGLCVELQVQSALVLEPAAAKALLTRQARKPIHPDTLGGDKGSHTRAFLQYLRMQDIRRILPASQSARRRNLLGAPPPSELYRQ